MDDSLSASDVLKLANISRATLTRWMDDVWAAKKGLTAPFPAGDMRDGRTKQWDRRGVDDWLEANAEKLGRHRSEAPRRLSEYQAIPLSFEKALRAAERASEELGVPFNVSEEVASIEEKLVRVLHEKGVEQARWDGGSFNFEFGSSNDANENRFLFLMTYS